MEQIRVSELPHAGAGACKCASKPGAWFPKLHPNVWAAVGTFLEGAGSPAPEARSPGLSGTMGVGWGPCRAWCTLGGTEPALYHPLLPPASSSSEEAMSPEGLANVPQATRQDRAEPGPSNRAVGPKTKAQLLHHGCCG